MRGPFRFVAADEIVAVVESGVVACYVAWRLRVAEDNLVGMSASDGIFVVPFILVVSMRVVSHLDVGNVERDSVVFEKQCTVVQFHLEIHVLVPLPLVFNKFVLGEQVFARQSYCKD